MTFPKILGTGTIPDNYKENYTEIHEFLVLTGDDNVGYVKSRVSGGEWSCSPASIDILGFVDLTTGRMSGVKSTMKWVLTEEERSTKSYSKCFGKLKIYRIKGSAPQRYTGEKEKYNTPENLARLYVTEILGESVPNAFLFGVLEEYNKPVMIHSQVLGDFLLDKRFGKYGCECDWFGSKVWLDFYAEDDAEDRECVRNFERFWLDRAKWDRDIRKCAAADLLDLANEWREDRNYDAEVKEPPITEESFMRRIKLSSVHLMDGGDFDAWFDDDKMFGYHSVVVWGNLEKGPEKATMEG